MRADDADHELRLMPFAEPIWVTTHPYTWEPTAGARNAPAPVDVPIGFVTNLASVPKSFWSLLGSDEKYASIAVVHDYLYWSQETGRHEADAMFLMGLSQAGVPAWKRWLLFLSLKLVGDVVWNRNQEDQEDGLRRMLRVLPQRPPVSWSVWRQGDVF